jgi:hypothetical protein
MSSLLSLRTLCSSTQTSSTLSSREYTPLLTCPSSPPPLHLSLTPQLITGILAIPKSFRVMFFSWLKHFSSEFFSRILLVMQTFLSFILSNKSTNFDPTPVVLVIDRSPLPKLPLLRLSFSFLLSPTASSPVTKRQTSSLPLSSATLLSPEPSISLTNGASLRPQMSPKSSISSPIHSSSPQRPRTE